MDRAVAIAGLLLDELDRDGALLGLLDGRLFERSLDAQVALLVQLTLQLLVFHAVRHSEVLHVLAVLVVRAILALLLTFATDLQRIFVEFDRNFGWVKVAQIQVDIELVVLDGGHGQFGAVQLLLERSWHEVVQRVDEEVVVQGLEQRTGESRERQHRGLFGFGYQRQSDRRQVGFESVWARWMKRRL